jgi:hypothetical protein
METNVRNSVIPELEDAMQIELHCPNCFYRFCAEPETPAEDVFDRMSEEGPWQALGDGETFEDMIFSTLTATGAIQCPECGEPVSVSEESLGEMTMELLSRW